MLSSLFVAASAAPMSENPQQAKLEANANVCSVSEGPGLGPRIFYTSEQKRQAAYEASRIKEHNPNMRLALHNRAELGRPSIALALGGGGARGAAHIGVLKVFEKAGIPIDYIVANSMGSLVGGLYSAGVPLDDIQNTLVDASLRKSYMGAVAPKVIATGLAKATHVFDHGYAGLWTGNKFQRFIESKLPDPGMQVVQTKIPFSPVATNLLDGQAYLINDGLLSRAIEASAAITPIIKPVQIDDKVYVDGGVRANLPASAARDAGCDIVIAVLVDEPLRKLPAKRFTHWRGVANRMVDIVLAVADERQLQFADVVINPDVSNVPIFSGKRSDAERAELAGEEAARKALPIVLKKIHDLGYQQSAVASNQH